MAARKQKPNIEITKIINLSNNEEKEKEVR